MIAEPKHEVHRDNTVRGKRERRRHEKALDEALENTFPASDPVSAEQPVLPLRIRLTRQLSDRFSR